VAGDKAFNWEKEFPEVFAKGGFDVVIGNPPYVRAELIIVYKKYLERNYESYHGNADLYVYFYELGMNLLTKSGILSFIAPNKWVQSQYGLNLRKHIGSKYTITRFIDFGESNIFEGVGTFPSIVVIEKQNIAEDLMYSELFDISKIKNGDLNGLDKISIDKSTLKNDDWFFKNSGITKLLTRLENKFPRLDKVFRNQFLAGVKTGANGILILSDEEVQRITENSDEQEIFKKIVFGRNIKKYSTESVTSYVFFPYKYKNGKQILIDLETYPKTYSFFKNNYQELVSRAIIKEGVVKGTHQWFELQQINKVFDYEKPKIIYPDIAIDNRFVLDCDGLIPDMTCFFIPTDEKALLPILNSRFFKFLASNYCPILGNINEGGRIRYKSTYLAQIPFPLFEAQLKNLRILAGKSENARNSFNSQSAVLMKYCTQKFSLDKLSQKLQSWHELTFAQFITELNAAIKKAGGNKLSKLDEMEWMELFEAKKKEAQELKSEIERVDREIDGMVYGLYGLTEEEVKIVEQN
jgi:hypothetical protein